MLIIICFIADRVHFLIFKLIDLNDMFAATLDDKIFVEFVPKMESSKCDFPAREG